MPSIDRKRRQRAGIPRNNKQAKAAPPAVYQGAPLDLGLTNAPVVEPVVLTVRVPLPLEAPVMSTGEVAPKLKVGWSTAPLGLDVTAAERVTLPVNPPLGVTVTVSVPLLPAGTVRLGRLAASKNEAGTAAVTVILTVVGIMIAPDVPVTVTA